MRIQNYSGICRTPAMPLLVKGWLELLKRDHCQTVMMMDAAHDALVAFDDAGKAVGVFSYGLSKETKEVEIHLVWIKPEARGAGLYDALWDAMVAKARELGAVHISTSTRLTNASMRRAAKRTGLHERSVSLVVDVSPSGELTEPNFATERA